MYYMYKSLPSTTKITSQKCLNLEIRQIHDYKYFAFLQKAYIQQKIVLQNLKKVRQPC